MARTTKENIGKFAIYTYDGSRKLYDKTVYKNWHGQTTINLNGRVVVVESFGEVYRIYGWYGTYGNREGIE